MFKKENDLGTYNWHIAILDKSYNNCFFNWRLGTFQIGFHLNISSIGIDYYIAILASIHGSYVWNKRVRKQLEDARRKQYASLN
jgi:hypothetical protein